MLASRGSVHLPCSMRDLWVARHIALVVVLVATAACRTENNNGMFEFYKSACVCQHTIIQPDHTPHVQHLYHTFTMYTVHPSERTSRCRLGTTPPLPSITGDQLCSHRMGACTFHVPCARDLWLGFTRL